MRTWRQAAWLIIRVVFIVGIIAALYWFTVRRVSAPPNPVSVPLPTFVPTFALAAPLATKVASVAQGTPLPNAPYLCSLVDAEQPKTTAICTDCWLYPVDRTHALPARYTPPLIATGLTGGGYVRVEAKQPLANLFSAAIAEGNAPTITSAYRSFQEQERVFDTWVAVEYRAALDQTLARARAATYSAQAGHSEHQLGTAIDVNCASCQPFDSNDARNLALWRFLEQNAHRFGFVISYPRGIEALTGYQYEPWHIRYVGIQHAVALYAAGYLEQTGACLTGYLRTLRVR